MAQNIEFIFAPPAIAFAIGAYFNLFLPGVPIILIAIIAYIVFTALNISGIKAAAFFELIITALAVIELLIFAGVTLPHFEYQNLTINPLPNGIAGIFAAIPFAIWFFLAIEGVANVAEETINPQRNVLIGFGSAIATLVILCILTFSSAVGVAGWEAIVYPEPGAAPSDSPLPLALGKVVGEGHLLFHLLIVIGLFGLIASFHGIILVAGRAVLEFGRFGYAPAIVGKVNSRFKTPANALIINLLIGIVALMTGRTGEIITIACFGALTLYVISNISLFALRKKEPDLKRPFKVPMYPVFPAVSLFISSVALVAMSVIYFKLAVIYFGILGVAFAIFSFTNKKEINYH